MSPPPTSLDRRRSWFHDIAGAPVEFLAAEFADFRYPKHLHESLAVGIIERGAQRFATKHGTVLMPQQELCVVDAGLVHWGWADDTSGWRYRMVYPSADTVAAALECNPADAQRLGFGVHTIADPGLFASFGDLHRRAQLGDDVDADLMGFLRSLFGRHAAVQTPRESPSARVAAVMAAYLHDHPNRTVSSEELASVVGVSVGHALRSFSKAMGTSPSAYHVAMRVDRARHLLWAGVPVGQVAGVLGFFDQSHLHRHFVRHVGCTPGQYAAAC